MKDKMMKKLIVNNDMLVYLHDLLSLKEKNTNYNQIDVFKVLQESNFLTLIKGLRYTRNIFFSFIIMLLILKLLTPATSFNTYSILMILFISFVYGILFVSCKKDFSNLIYQFKLKKAAQFAINNYSYAEYVIFLDKYLSEISTLEYRKNKMKLNN